MSQLALCLSLATVILFLRQCEHTTVVPDSWYQRGSACNMGEPGHVLLLCTIYPYNHKWNKILFWIWNQGSLLLVLNEIRDFEFLFQSHSPVWQYVLRRIVVPFSIQFWKGEDDLEQEFMVFFQKAISSILCACTHMRGCLCVCVCVCVCVCREYAAVLFLLFFLDVWYIYLYYMCSQIRIWSCMCLFTKWVNVLHVNSCMVWHMWDQRPFLSHFLKIILFFI